MTGREHLARAMWTLFEPIHAVGYFSPESREAFAAIGLTRFWDGYFAGRAAPLGAVNGAPVTAMFSGFAPAMVERALPAAWSIAPVEQVLEARAAGAEATLRGFFGDDDVVAEVADALTFAAARADTVGRPLSAANQALRPYADPYRRLWQATTVLREHRGDGHVIALVDGDIAGISTIVLRSAVDMDAATMMKARGWNDAQWSAATAALGDRGLLDADGAISVTGVDALNRAERTTNRLSTAPWAALDDAEMLRIATLLAPLSRACSVLFPYPNPIGMPTSWDPVADPEAASVPAAPA